jgi:hypothetical protein
MNTINLPNRLLRQPVESPPTDRREQQIANA